MPPFEQCVDLIPTSEYGSTPQKTEFSSYLRNATNRFFTNTVLTCLKGPDYSTLPAEILQIIARDVAALHCHENTNLKISPDLFKMRLICQSFSDAATATWIALTRQERFADYRILHFPPRSGSLESVKKSFARSDQTISSLVTSLTYHITSAPSATIDEDALGEYYCEEAPGGCECEEVCLLCDAGELVHHNAEVFENQNHLQTRFAKHMAGPHGRRLLSDILSALPNLRKIRVEVQDFWDMFCCYTSLPAEDGGTASVVYRKALPVFFECFPRSPSSILELEGFGSAVWQDFVPTKFFTCPEYGTFLTNITDLDMVISHRDNLYWMEDDDGDEEVRTRSLERADRLNLVLFSAKNLKSFRLTCRLDCPFVVSKKGGVKWLFDVLRGLHFSKLEHFSLKNFLVNRAILHPFLSQHAATLNTLAIEEVAMKEASWLTLLQTLRPQLSLTAASIVIERFTEPQELVNIIKECEDGTGPSNDKKFVDVGTYWMRSRR